ncbi:hypothetical protein BC828DRAFT_385940 [Blastocladiella britannica]|nr:hypothetical protein BC828DRAFT_385940 [Blastocladiella britannica]
MTLIPRPTGTTAAIVTHAIASAACVLMVRSVVTRPPALAAPVAPPALVALIMSATEAWTLGLVVAAPSDPLPGADSWTAWLSGTLWPWSLLFAAETLADTYAHAAVGMGTYLTTYLLARLGTHQLVLPLLARLSSHARYLLVLVLVLATWLASVWSDVTLESNRAAFQVVSLVTVSATAAWLCDDLRGPGGANKDFSSLPSSRASTAAAPSGAGSTRRDAAPMLGSLRHLAACAKVTAALAFGLFVTTEARPLALNLSYSAIPVFQLALIAVLGSIARLAAWLADRPQPLERQPHIPTKTMIRRLARDIVLALASWFLDPFPSDTGPWFLKGVVVLVASTAAALFYHESAANSIPTSTALAAGSAASLQMLRGSGNGVTLHRRSPSYSTEPFAASALRRLSRSRSTPTGMSHDGSVESILFLPNGKTSTVGSVAAAGATLSVRTNSGASGHSDPASVPLPPSPYTIGPVPVTASSVPQQQSSPTYSSSVSSSGMSGDAWILLPSVRGFAVGCAAILVGGLLLQSQATVARDPQAYSFVIESDPNLRLSADSVSPYGGPIELEAELSSSATTAAAIESDEAGQKQWTVRVPPPTAIPLRPWDFNSTKGPPLEWANVSIGVSTYPASVRRISLLAQLWSPMGRAGPPGGPFWTPYWSTWDDPAAAVGALPSNHKNQQHRPTAQQAAFHASVGRYPVVIEGDPTSVARSPHVKWFRMLQALVASAPPSVAWFVLADDDTLFFPDTLLQTLASVTASSGDPRSQFMYVGDVSEVPSQAERLGLGMAFGGGGAALSRPLAEAVAANTDQCLRLFQAEYGGDGRLAKCVGYVSDQMQQRNASGAHLTRVPAFNQFDLWGFRDPRLYVSARLARAAPATVHHYDGYAPLVGGGRSVADAVRVLHGVAGAFARGGAPHLAFRRFVVRLPRQRGVAVVTLGFHIRVYWGSVAAGAVDKDWPVDYADSGVDLEWTRDVDPGAPPGASSSRGTQQRTVVDEVPQDFWIADWSVATGSMEFVDAVTGDRVRISCGADPTQLSLARLCSL